MGHGLPVLCVAQQQGKEAKLLMDLAVARSNGSGGRVPTPNLPQEQCHLAPEGLQISRSSTCGCNSALSSPGF